MLFCNCLVFSRVKVIVAWLSLSSSPTLCFIPQGLETRAPPPDRLSGNASKQHGARKAYCQQTLWKTQPLYADATDCPRVVVSPQSPEAQN